MQSMVPEVHDDDASELLELSDASDESEEFAASSEPSFDGELSSRIEASGASPSEVSVASTMGDASEEEEHPRHAPKPFPS